MVLLHIGVIDLFIPLRLLICGWVRPINWDGNKNWAKIHWVVSTKCHTQICHSLYSARFSSLRCDT